MHFSPNNNIPYLLPTLTLPRVPLSANDKFSIFKQKFDMVRNQGILAVYRALVAKGKANEIMHKFPHLTLDSWYKAVIRYIA